MSKGNENKLSWIISIGIHLVIVAVLFFITISAKSETDEFVTVGFGAYGNVSKPGVKGNSKKKNKTAAKHPSKKIKTKPKLKKVSLPKSKANATANIIKKKNSKAKSKPEASVKSVDEKKTNANKGKEETGIEKGSTGFKIDFGGRGIRKIYSYSLPKYPGGVSKEIDIKLRFTILPDGTVGKVFPLIKADALLEAASISSLRQWRFEPLPKSLKQVEQKAVIVFPYRLQ